MREIKFRGLRTDGEWAFGCFVNAFPSTPRIVSENNSYPVKPETVGQFTGLTDKNGKEIYEGDIVRCNEFENKNMLDMTMEEREVFSFEDLKGKLRETYISAIRFEEGGFEVDCHENCTAGLGFFFGDQRHSSPMSTIEVIGNINENPELLK